MPIAEKKTVKDWVRVAAKLGLLFTEPKARAAVGNRVKDGIDDLRNSVEDVTDTVASRYEDAVDRFEHAVDAFQHKGSWPARATGFLLGVGIGAGLGLLLAPAPGSQIRESVRGTAIDMKNRIRRSVMSMPSTGTET
jgi:gas vesicle protein